MGSQGRKDEAEKHRAAIEKTRAAGAKLRHDLEWFPDGVEWEPGAAFVFLPDGYAIPATFTVRARSGDGQVRAAIDVEVEGKRAWPRRVEIASDLPGGVNSVAVRGLPIRQVMGFGVSAVHRMTVQGQEAGMARMAQVEDLDPEATRLMASLVGYIDAGQIAESLAGEEGR
jgi:hypothetical protein